MNRKVRQNKKKPGPARAHFKKRVSTSRNDKLKRKSRSFMDVDRQNGRWIVKELAVAYNFPINQIVDYGAYEQPGLHRGGVYIKLVSGDTLYFGQQKSPDVFDDVWYMVGMSHSNPTVRPPAPLPYLNLQPRRNG
jgi:hypothetical protein